MASTEEIPPQQEQDVPGEKEATKTPSPKPDTDVAPPLIEKKGKICLEM